MTDITATADTDRRPAIVICAWDAGDPAWDPIEDLSGEPWSPEGARTVATPGAEPDVLAGTLSRMLAHRDTRGLLLIGRSRRGDAFQLQLRAENKELGGVARLDRDGPGMARSTAPVADMLRALNEAGLDASATSEAEDDAGSYLLYRVLSSLPEGADTPAVGLLRAPAHEDEAAVSRAVKTAAQEMARHLSLLPRSQA